MRKVASFLGLALILAAAGCNGYDKEDFSTTLNQANEVPPTGVTQTGTFNITFNGPVAEWSLAIAGGLPEVTVAHIHQGANGATGSPMVFLYDGPTATVTNLVGSFNQDQVVACGAGCLTGRSFANLQSDVAAGNAYVNVHTVTFGGGAIRGDF